MFSITMIKEPIPIKAWKKAVLKHINMSPMIIETDLKQIDESNNLHIRLCKEYNWHYQDTMRSLLQKMERPLSKYEFSYYDRIYQHFGIDQVKLIQENTSLIINTWDNNVDYRNLLKPCLVTLKIIENNDFLHLSTTFRMRDIIKRLYFNYLALNQFQKSCCSILNRKQGILFDYSNQAFRKKVDYLKIMPWREFNDK